MYICFVIVVIYLVSAYAIKPLLITSFFFFSINLLPQSQLCLHCYVNITNISFPFFAVTKGKGIGKDESDGPEVCRDPVRLTSYAVGVNIFKVGDDPHLKPPDQYPEW